MNKLNMPLVAGVRGHFPKVSSPRFHRAASSGVLVLLLGACAGGTLACSSTSASTCEYGGQGYDEGDTFPDADGCNNCVCQGDGNIACTLIGCSEIPLEGVGCEIDGVAYESGEEVPSNDCNTCSCQDGGVECTLVECSTEPNPTEPGEACTAPFEGGECDAAIPSFWHNPETDECEERTYGGCGGNDNRYETLDDCQEACSESE